MTALVHSGCQSKKYHGVGGLNDRNPMFAILGAGKSKFKVAESLAFLEDLLPGLQMVLFSSRCHPVASRERGSLLLDRSALIPGRPSSPEEHWAATRVGGGVISGERM